MKTRIDTSLAPVAGRRLAIAWRKIDELTPDPRNPRAHTEEQVRRLARSIEAFGFNVPVLIDGEAKVLAGHGRLLAARELNWGAVPTIALDHLSEPEARAFMIADNRLAEMSTWDDRLLASQLSELSLPELDLEIEATGFALDEIELRIGAPRTASARHQWLRKRQVAVSRDGQTWHLGPHRVVCGAVLDESAWDMLRSDTPGVVILADAARADAIIRRWQSETGGTAHDKTSGSSFDMLSSTHPSLPAGGGGLGRGRARRRMAKDEGEYKVGYGKPPLHTRFQKGRTGNPRGRPRGSKNLATAIAEALAEPVIVIENGKRRMITKRNAIIAQLVNRSAQADPRATKLLLDLIRSFEPRTTEPPPAGPAEDPREVLLRGLNRLAAAGDADAQRALADLGGGESGS